MNKLNDSHRAAIIRALVEGNSVRATSRLTRTAKATVLKLLVEVGEFCSIYSDNALQNLSTTRIEAEEIWSFVGAKAKNATMDGHGDLWTYTAIDADSKLIISWLVGQRNHKTTEVFMVDVAERLANRVQVTTDGLGWYLSAVENAFGWNGVDFAQIVKTYGMPRDETERARRYSPMVCTDAIKTRIMGEPNMDNLSTWFVERSNLSMRMGIRRSTRITNAFSKKAENHAHAVSLYFMFYNYCRPHQTLTKAANGIKTIPAMAAKLTDHVWTIEEILEMMGPNYPLH